MLPQALDFAQEVRVLAELLDGLPAAQWQQSTQFKPVSYTHLTLPTICSV